MQALAESLRQVRMLADTGARPGGTISQPYVLLDGSGDRYYVAVLNSPAPGNVLAADLISYQFLRLLGWANYEACLAVLDFPLKARFATRPSGIMVPASYANGPPEVEAGPHFATRELPDGHEPLSQVEKANIAEPVHAVAIWAFDTWVGITDRQVSGNLRGYPSDDGKLVLAPIDNGNAFFGPVWGGSKLLSRTPGKRVAAVSGTVELTADIGVACLPGILSSIDRIGEATIRAILATVPSEWGFDAGHQAIAAEFLLGRQAILPALFPEHELGR